MAVGFSRRGSSGRPPRNYSQLDLFTPASPDSTIAAEPELAATETEATNAGEDAAWDENSQPLADAPSGDGSPTAQGAPAGADASRNGGERGRPPVRTDLREEAGLPSGVGSGDGAVGLPSERGPPIASIVRNLEPPTEESPSRDFRITDSHHIGEGSIREKAQTNLEAIRTLKRIEADNRDATPEEQAALVRYTGWGAMAGAFRPHPSRDWQGVAEQLRELLTKDEYDAARAGMTAG